jgi:16S rRNA (cytosine967-C5)-methyltransferase
LIRKQDSTLPPARSASLTILRNVLQRGAGIQAALDDYLRSVALDSRDATLATELTYGYLRHKGRIGHILRTFLPRPGKLPPSCLLAIGVATYERLFLDRVPEYATRSWLTTFIHKSWGSGLARLSTAYMTTLDGHLPDLLTLDFYRQDGCALDELWSRYYSLPSWIISLWLSAYGEERTQQLAMAQMLPASLGLRINPLHPEVNELVHRLAMTPDLHRSGQWGIACEHGRARTLFPDLNKLLAQGRLSRQSLASQLVLDAQQMDNVPGPFWDVCAGRGAKTCYLLERTNEAVRASDVNWRRLLGLQAEIRRLGLRNIPIARARSDSVLPWGEQAGFILIDAPCSGLGVLARRPDIKWKRTPADLPALLALQHRMLQVGASSLRQSGRVLYITCTMNPAENEAQIDRLLREQSGLRRLEHCQESYGLHLREFFWVALLEKK